jgi:hypothetical protein
VTHPDHFVDHYPHPSIPQDCSRCGATLDGTASRGYRKRQVFDLPKPQPLQVTEHRAHLCSCPSCGESTTAAFPESVTAITPYGPNLTARVVYLQPSIPFQKTEWLRCCTMSGGSVWQRAPWARG